VPGPLQIGFEHYFGMAANIGSGPHSFIIDEEVSGHVQGEPIIVHGGSREGDSTTASKKPGSLITSWRRSRGKFATGSK